MLPLLYPGPGIFLVSGEPGPPTFSRQILDVCLASAPQWRRLAHYPLTKALKRFPIQTTPHHPLVFLFLPLCRTGGHHQTHRAEHLASPAFRAPPAGSRRWPMSSSPSDGPGSSGRAAPAGTTSTSVGLDISQRPGRLRGSPQPPKVRSGVGG